MQLRTSKTIIFFHERFKNKYNFEDYSNYNKPTLFFGVYRKNDIDAIIKHKGIKIVWFAGSDSSIILEGINSGVYNKSFLDGSTVIAESDWIAKDLDKIGVKYERISFLMDNIYNWRPVPLGDSLYWYNAGNSKYGKEYLPIVKKAIPDLNIIKNDSKTVPRDKMPDVYAECFAGVRPIDHDGMSQTVAEMGLMGRMSIYNGGGPFSIPYNSIESLIEEIKRLRVGYNEKLVSKRSRGYFISQETKWTDLVLRLCGTNELGATNIFDETTERCGSIFRIMRKDVVDSFSLKFGDKQMERPYISEELRKRNLKQLITSKNSGFIVSEFKGLGNKGYPKDLKDFNTYDPKY